MHQTPKDQTVSRYETLRQVEKTLRKPANSMIKMPEMPVDCYAVWGVFFDLFGSVGVDNITYSEIQSYCELTGATLESWELKIIMILKSISISPKADNNDN